MERLRPMSPEPSSSQIIHMAFVILAFSSAGILTRDLNKHNWGIRKFSSDGVIQELVAIDGADWHQEGGPTPFPPRRRLESWWKCIEGVDPATAFATRWRDTTRTMRSWRRPCCRGSKSLRQANGWLRLSTSKRCWWCRLIVTPACAPPRPRLLRTGTGISYTWECPGIFKGGSPPRENPTGGATCGATHQ